MNTLHVIETPNGAFAFAGRVPFELVYIATPEQLALIAADGSFGERFARARAKDLGVERTDFTTRAAAVEYATSRGYAVEVAQ